MAEHENSELSASRQEQFPIRAHGVELLSDRLQPSDHASGSILPLLESNDVKNASDSLLLPQLKLSNAEKSDSVHMLHEILDAVDAVYVESASAKEVISDVNTEKPALLSTNGTGETVNATAEDAYNETHEAVSLPLEPSSDTHFAANSFSHLHPISPPAVDCSSTISSSADEEEDADTIELNRLRALNQQLELDLSVCKREHEAALTKLRLQLASVMKEKDDTVMKFAVKETQILDAQKSRDAADRKSREAAGESEKARKQAAKMKEERDRACADADKKTKDMQQAKREADQLRNDVKERDGRIKWLQDRLKYEMEQHQQCKTSLDSTTTMLADRVKHFDKLESIFSHVSSALGLNALPAPGSSKNSSLTSSPIRSAAESTANLTASPDSQSTASVAAANSPSESLRIAAVIQQHLQNLTEKQHSLEQRCCDESRLATEIELHRNLLNEKTQEVDMLNAKLECIKAEMRISQQSITQLNETLRMQQGEIETLQNVRHRKIELDAELHAAQQSVAKVQTALDDSRQELIDYKADTQRTLDCNRELMEYTEKLTARIVHQQAGETQCKTDAENATNALQILESTHSILEADFKDLKTRYDANVTSVEVRCTTLQTQNDALLQRQQTLQVELDELKNEHRIAVRNHAAIVRDLKHQLASFTRNESSSMLKVVNGGGINFDTLSVHSSHDDTRTSFIGGVVRKTFSNNSLSQSATVTDGSPNTVPHFVRRGSLVANNSEAVEQHRRTKASLPTSPEKKFAVEKDFDAAEAAQQPHTVPVEQTERQMLIERNVRLQRRVAKRNERIEAFNEQLRLAYEEIQKKTSIIERFAMNCDDQQLIGVNHPNAVEAKSLKQGVLASIFAVAGGGNGGGTTTPPPLTVEINRKLQAVLEDTLFRNITLKENLQTLGDEISKLSRDNEDLRSRLKQ